jgi:hypothetical protein
MKKARFKAEAELRRGLRDAFEKKGTVHTALNDRS